MRSNCFYALGFCLLLIGLMAQCASKQPKIDPQQITKKELIMALKPISDTSQYNQLTTEETQIIVHKGTEYPYTGELLENKTEGIYVCKRCEAPLYRSEDKFESYCGWPSFDDEIKGAVLQVPDADGRRTEILCNHCKGHLGHVFIGEGFTTKNTRHCVNSLSMKFISKEEIQQRIDAQPNASALKILEQ
jgi:peptide-methionine (R)-S-oxide reductase